MSHSYLRRFTFAALVCVPLHSIVMADCYCQSEHREGVPASFPAPTGPPVMDSAGLGAGLYPQSIEAAPVMPGVNYQPAPPPGTIGQTYQRPSKPVPVKKHPRTGMVDVCVPGATEVIVHDVNPMRTEDTLEGFRDEQNPDLWHFSTEPLYPGLTHIYRIEARFGDPAGGQVQERYVRLIRGRIVTISF